MLQRHIFHLPILHIQPLKKQGRLRSLLEDEDEGGDQLIGILLHMVKFEAQSRWPATTCLIGELKAGLFKRRMADGLIVCADPEEENPKATIKTPISASPSLRAPRQQSGIDPNATVIR